MDFNSLDSTSLDSLQTYEVIDSNPYHIKKVYTQANNTINSQDFQTNIESTKTTQSQPIDYIIFLDSDDYLDHACIQSCIESNINNQAQIIFYEDAYIFDGIEKQTLYTWQETCGFKKATFITPSIWLDKTIQTKADYFGVTRGVVIDFNFLQTIKLKFLNGIYHEDILFGVILFMQAKNILILPNKYYYYRLRAGSICNYGSIAVKIPFYLEKILPYFNGSTKLVSQYNLASSWALIALHTLEFLQNFADKELAQSFEKAFMPFYAKQFLLLFECRADPLNLRPKFPLLLPYLENTPLSFYERILAFHPLLRPIAVKIHHFYLWQKDLERRFRWWRKGRKVKCKLGKAAK
ncbi:hypothetical protein CQA49_01155 [Helicobacter sp. MIT 00-7814]|uniref:hypothetical protein n=1 Tax=unclassified Helicobacter TaxID=2593540 RepID=UPI000E1F8F82|nr:MULTISPECIES: hypothetical protein [unclassified Helicobacter]RDU53313.1 hypothetical protein CQA37_07330 [Helicobacter sp. MIT 99-10781]RDU56934.1 hypothetical protein CQA49_01155 [Helicobacter sp. MIT 00-7814]